MLSRPAADMSSSAYHITAQQIADMYEFLCRSLAKSRVNASRSFIDMIYPGLRRIGELWNPFPVVSVIETFDLVC